MSTVIRLPPVDVYRTPYVVPLGHLVLNAAQAENHLIELAAVVNGGLEETADRSRAYEAAASKLRNWDERSREYFAEALNKIADPDARRDAEDALRRFHECRGRRHRAIHDAVDVGLDVADNGRANAIGLRTRYLPNGTREVVPFTPDEVAGLAYEFYDIAKDFESIEYRIMRVPDPPGSGTTK
jgi:hypothetical protein